MNADGTEETDDSPSVALRWQLTPSNAGLLRALLYASWAMSGGLVALVFGGVAFVLLGPHLFEGAALPTAEQMQPGVTATFLAQVAVSGTAGLVAFGVLLRALAVSRYGLTFLRLRTPEPTDPTRSVVEHAPLWVLVGLAGVGAAVHAAGFGFVVSLERSSFWYLLPLGGLYLTLIAVRWWLPTAGELESTRLRVRSFPHEGVTGNAWHGQFETTAEVSLEELEGVHSRQVGAVAIVALSRSTGSPIVAAVPSTVRSHLDDAVRTKPPTSSNGG